MLVSIHFSFLMLIWFRFRVLVVQLSVLFKFCFCCTVCSCSRQCAYYNSDFLDWKKLYTYEYNQGWTLGEAKEVVDSGSPLSEIPW